MPVLSITTTARDVFLGDSYLQSLIFKNGSTTGIIYLRNRSVNSVTVTSSNYELSLTAGQTVGYNRVNDGEGIRGPWEAISDTGGGVNLEVLATYSSERRI